MSYDDQSWQSLRDLLRMRDVALSQAKSREEKLSSILDLANREIQAKGREIDRLNVEVTRLRRVLLEIGEK